MPPLTEPNLEPEYWRNWLSDYDHIGMKAEPANEQELIDAVAWAVQEGRRLRAVGSGHSHSNCGRPRDMFVDMSRITGRFASVDWLKTDPPGLAAGEELVRVKAGTTLKELGRLILPEMNPPLGLINTGTFDGQTLAGAISTGTHGTGMRLGSLADMVVSMDIVTVTKDADGIPEVRMRRIEPTNGVTDRAAFDRDHAAHGMVLEQDDDLFYAMVISFGCMGIAYAYTLKVREEYWLREDTEFLEWPALSVQLGAMTRIPGGIAPAIADSARHVWFILNIAEMQGTNKTQSPACFLIKRDIVNAKVEPDNWSGPWPPERKSDFWKELGQDVVGVDPTAQHDRVGATIRNNLVNNDVGEPAFQGDRWSSASYIAHRREQEDKDDDDPPEPPPVALSVEIAVPCTDITAAITAAIDCVERSQIFFIAPWGVRFSAASGHFLSPAYDRATAWVEVAILLPTPLFNPQRTMEEVRDEIAKPELEKIEAALCYAGTFGGRPHLGKHHTVDRSRVEQIFPRFDLWLAAYQRFNALGTFDNAFTDQLGLDLNPPAAEAEQERWLEAVLHVMMS